MSTLGLEVGPGLGGLADALGQRAGGDADVDRGVQQLGVRAVHRRLGEDRRERHDVFGAAPRTSSRVTVPDAVVR